MLWAVLVGFVAALASPWLSSQSRPWGKWLLALIPVGLFAYFSTYIFRVTGLTALRSSYPWIPALDIGLSFRLDGLSLIFALIITFIGSLIVLYSFRYMEGDRRLGGLLGLLLAFMGSMLGLVLCSNLIVLYFFWELTSLFSYFLIGFERHEEKARKAAWTALLITSLGGLSLLAGFLLLARIGGTFDLDDLLLRGPEIRAHPLYTPATVLIFVGAFTKSAQFPFHFWLPDAMRAPTPVSAYLHSATMVKAGIYLLARLHPALGETHVWREILLAAGGATMLTAAWLALSQVHLKALLAYGTIWALGALTALLGLGTAHAVEVAIVLLVAHSLYKACLFMVAGIIDHQTGIKDVEKLGGLRKTMPFTCLAALAGAISMAGLPPSIGFLAKELLLSVGGSPGPYGIAFLAIGLFSAMSIFYVAAMVAFRPFFHSLPAGISEVREAKPLFLLGPLLLSVLGIAFGLVSWPLSQELLSPAVSAVLGREEWVELSLWHGVNLALALSLVTIAGGVGLFRYRLRVRAALSTAQFRLMAQAGPAALIRAAAAGVLGLAGLQVRLLQSGYLRVYLSMALVAALALIGYAVLEGNLALPPLAALDLLWDEAALVLFMLVAIGVVLASDSRMLAVAALGSVGFGMVILFVLQGAPDLAMTQFLVEIVTLLLLLLAFYHLPSFQDRSRRSSRVLSAVLAAGAGLCVAVVTYAVMGREPSRLNPDFFAARSLEEAHGRNIVNVILVDFRAFDTLGEITVLAVAALSVMALLGKPSVGPARRNVSVIFRTAIRFIKPLMLLFSLFLLATGHNAPGGGFVGGLMAASAYILVTMGEGASVARRSLPFEPATLIGLGLWTALAGGLAGMASGEPFLKGLWLPASPIAAGLALGTPLLFDLGVYLLVAGITLGIVLEFGEA